MFERDEDFASTIGPAYGQYVTTFKSQPQGQARVDVFRIGKSMMAYVSFPTGLNGGNVTEPYATALYDFAREQGAADHLHLFYS